MLARDNNTQRWLILVRHGQPQIVPDLPASEWRLAEAGKPACQALAEGLYPYLPARLCSSPELKAVETARIVGEALGLAFEVGPGLEEHHREAGDFTDPARFEAAVKQLFSEPERLSFGLETGGQAYRRFAKALAAFVDTTQAGNLIIVSHGTVICLYLALHLGRDGYQEWKRLGLASFVALPFGERLK